MRKAQIFLWVMALAAYACSSVIAQGKSTRDPNTPSTRAAQPAVISEENDPRLDQKITCMVKLKQASDIAADLKKMTGITFLAGRSISDWLVREHKMTIHAKDIPLRTLMNAIARVSKYHWVRAGKAPNWTYRLCEDPAQVARIKKLESERKKQGAETRRKFLDKFMNLDTLSGDELLSLRKTNPGLYVEVKAGVAKNIKQMLIAAPQLRNALIAGEKAEIDASMLSPGAREAVANTMTALINMNIRLYDIPEDMMQKAFSLIGNNRDKFKVSIMPGNTHDPSGAFSISYTSDCELYWSMRRVSSEINRLLGETELRAYEEKRPFADIYKEMRPLIVAARAAVKPDPGRLWSFTDDPITEHPGTPEQHIKTSKKLETDRITDMVFKIAEVSGLAIVTGNFRGKINFSKAEGTELKDVLNAIPEHYGENWEIKNGVIELWHRNWYENEQSRVCEAWLESLRQRAKATGTLDLDDLADIAELRDGQMRNIYSDDVLNFVTHFIFERRDYLKFYRTLTSAQREMLFGESGLDFASLAADQQSAAKKLVSSVKTPVLENTNIAAAGLRIFCTREKENNCFLYTLQAFTRMGPIPGQLHIRTPLYVPPKAKNDATATNRIRQ